MSTYTESDSWRGVNLTDIWGAESPWGAPEFPAVGPGDDHAVLYIIPSLGSGDQPLEPVIGEDKWDDDFVKMPCSSQSLLQVQDSSGEIHMKKRWDLIRSALSQPIGNSQKLADAILSYNTQLKDTWKFKALHKLFNEHLEKEESQNFFDVTLPLMTKLALDLPRLIQTPIPVLKQNKNQSISITQQQIASLLANAFFCTFPRLKQEEGKEKTSEYVFMPRFNFNTLYETSGADHVLGKLKCLLNYFKRVCSEVRPGGVVTFSRRSMPDRCPDWAQSSAPLSVPLHVDSSSGIEGAHGLIQMDFANKRLGGGVLRRGCVQEEIRFVICPELLVSMLFTETLLPHEAVMIIGCERYSNHSGYSRTFRFEGDYRDVTPTDACRRRRVAVLAMDATPYRGDKYLQYTLSAINRELNKAWIGFSFYSDDSPGLQYPGIATGNWGCGAYGGFPQLKTLIQLMACAEARRPMAYYTFNDAGIRDEFVSIYDLLKEHKVTVAQLYQLIAQFSLTDVRSGNLHAFIQRALSGDVPLVEDTGQTSKA
ncbi:poly(ADP-ribose) glycohydrolase-like [Leguminivora glycinivorella]|uniref:poly(ADP-ribose) glycohydrolase-like n=1 Tax=Leguminivora glycinivorella TaxID=1035111 RepID=UPI00200EE0C5|nr:poly(ADP-ribose) glycohydrolase-like [Leguminivora glycinivorella]